MTVEELFSTSEDITMTDELTSTRGIVIGKCSRSGCQINL